jgi:hypothetical protein
MPYLTTSQNFTPITTIFGPGYMPEQHEDGTHHFLSTGEPLVDFDKLLKKLRTALSLASR